MTSKVPPAFQFYAADFDASTATMTAAEVGIYVRLICVQWERGHVPDSPKRLAGAARVSVPEMEEAWEVLEAKFPIWDDGKRRNRRLEDVRQDQLEYREKKVRAGKKSARVRKERHGTAQPPTASEPNTVPNTVPNSDRNTVPNTRPNTGPNSSRTLRSPSPSPSPEEIPQTDPPPPPLPPSEDPAPQGATKGDPGTDPPEPDPPGGAALDPPRELTPNQLEIQRAERMWTDLGLDPPEPRRIVAMRRDAGGIEPLIAAMRHLGHNGLAKGADYVHKSVKSYTEGRKRSGRMVGGDMARQVAEIEEEARRAASA